MAFGAAKPARKCGSPGRRRSARARGEAKARASHEDLWGVPRPVIIIIDEDPSIHPAMAAILGEQYEIVSLSSVDELLSLIEGYRPDVIMLDAKLPGKKGFSLKRVRSSARLHDIPIMLLTVLPNDEKLVGYACLAKPFEPAELVKTVNRLITPTTLPLARP